MTDDTPLFTQWGVTAAMPPLPDDVWERALSIALDPTTPPVDDDLVPEMDEVPIVPDDDGEIVLYDDTDDAPSPATSHDTIDDDPDGPHPHDDELDTGGTALGHGDPPTVHEDTVPLDLGLTDHPDDTLDDGPNLGHDLF